MEKILIEMILTNRCNKRCEYCDLNFENRSLTYSDLDDFSIFLKENEAEYTINFFGGEPLLEYKKLIYFVEKNKDVVKSFSVGTNGVFLDKEKLDFCKNNGIKIYLSVDNILSGDDVNLSLIKQYKDIIQINFINDPDYIYRSQAIFDRLIEYGFQDIAFMPVFNTKKRETKSLALFQTLHKYVQSHSSTINISTYRYFNGVAVDRQFILDSDTFFYGDLDSLLWLQKQYKNMPVELKDEIHSKTQLISLKSGELTLEELINRYNIKEIVRLVFEIPKKLGDSVVYRVIDNILKNGA